MIAEKYIETTVPCEFDITGITLLSNEEFMNFRHNIPPTRFRWWLRSPDIPSRVMSVDLHKTIEARSVNVDTIAIRPALQIKNVKDIKPADEFRLFDQDWTVLSKRLAICNRPLKFGCFHHDKNAPDANNYLKSDIKVFLEDWLKERMPSL